MFFGTLGLVLSLHMHLQYFHMKVIPHHTSKHMQIVEDKRGHGKIALQVVLYKHLTSYLTHMQTHQSLELSGTFHQSIFTKQEETRKYNLEVLHKILALTPGNTPIVLAFSQTRGLLPFHVSEVSTTYLLKYKYKKYYSLNDIILLDYY